MKNELASDVKETEIKQEIIKIKVSSFDSKDVESNLDKSQPSEEKEYESKQETLNNQETDYQAKEKNEGFKK